MRNLILFVGALSLAACGASQKGGTVSIVAPEATAATTASVPSADAVAQRLAKAGFKVTGQSGGTVRATSTSLNNLDCGTLRQVALGNKSEFAGNSEVAVIYRSEDPIVFVTRGVSTNSEVVVNVSGATARISESHNVTITWRNAKKELISNETKRVSGPALVQFSDKTVCTSSGRVADVIGG